MSPSHVLPGPKLVPTGAELPHLIPPNLQPPTPGVTPLPTNMVAQPQPLMPNTPSTRPPRQRSPQNPFPQPKNSALYQPPHIIPPDTSRYPFRHCRHQQPTRIRARYANAATSCDRFQNNGIIHPTTGALQEFCHLVMGPNKSTWYQSLANEFGLLVQGVGNQIDSTITINFIQKNGSAFQH